jgi:hypothetical protein
MPSRTSTTRVVRVSEVVLTNVGEPAGLVEPLGGFRNDDFRPQHGRRVGKDEGLPQVKLRAHPAADPGARAHDGRWLVPERRLLRRP